MTLEENRGKIPRGSLDRKAGRDGRNPPNHPLIWVPGIPNYLPVQLLVPAIKQLFSLIWTGYC